MTTAAAPNALSPDERDAIGRLLASAGLGDEIGEVEAVWGRRHLLRLATPHGSVIVKRIKTQANGTENRCDLVAECAALTICSHMSPAVAPKLFGVDLAVGLVMMEDLPRGLALSDLFLLGTANDATAGICAVARGLAKVHVSTMNKESAFADITSAGVPGERTWLDWQQRAILRRKAFGAVVTSFGLSHVGLDDEIDRALGLLDASPRRGLLHNDLCPDNVRVTTTGARLFDFEGAAFGPWAMDVAYLLAPFPSCWCFASLPGLVVDAAMRAYRDELTRAGVDLPDSWNRELVAALGCIVVARGAQVGDVDVIDEEWGTTTMRPRLLSWLETFRRHADMAETMPALAAITRSLCEALSERWGNPEVPAYPAFARVGERVAMIPDDWLPGL